MYELRRGQVTCTALLHRRNNNRHVADDWFRQHDLFDLGAAVVQPPTFAGGGVV